VSVVRLQAQRARVIVVVPQIGKEIHRIYSLT